MEEKKAWYSMHLVFSGLLVVLSAYIIIESLRASVPMLVAGNATILDMPGLSPIVCAGLLTLFAVLLGAEAFRKGGRLSYFISKEVRAALSGREAATVYKIGACLVVYVFFLWPLVPFWCSSGLFMFSLMAVFGELSWKTAAVSILTAGILWFVFNDLFQVMLPSRFFFASGVS